MYRQLPIEISISDEHGSSHDSTIRYIGKNIYSDDIKEYIRDKRKKDKTSIKIEKEIFKFIYKYKNIPFLKEFEDSHGSIKENIEFHEDSRKIKLEFYKYILENVKEELNNHLKESTKNIHKIEIDDFIDESYPSFEEYSKYYEKLFKRVSENLHPLTCTSKNESVAVIFEQERPRIYVTSSEKINSSMKSYISQEFVKIKSYTLHCKSSQIEDIQQKLDEFKEQYETFEYVVINRNSKGSKTNRTVDTNLLFAFVGDDNKSIIKKVTKKFKKYCKKVFSIESEEFEEYFDKSDYIKQFLEYLDWEYKSDIQKEFQFDSLDIDKEGKNIDIV